MAGPKSFLDKLWRVTRGEGDTGNHVAVRSGIVFVEDEDNPGRIIMAVVGNGARRPFRFASLTSHNDELTGTITAPGQQRFQLRVGAPAACDANAISEGNCSSKSKHLILFEFTPTPSVGAHGGGGGGTWYAED